MSANNIVVFEEQTNGTFNAYHRDMDAWCEGQYIKALEQPIFQAATMQECVIAFDGWAKSLEGFWDFVEYGYVFVLRVDNEANIS